MLAQPGNRSAPNAAADALGRVAWCLPAWPKRRGGKTYESEGGCHVARHGSRDNDPSHGQTSSLVLFPASAAEVTQPAAGVPMHPEYAKALARTAYVWGWPMVNR